MFENPYLVDKPAESWFESNEVSVISSSVSAVQGYQAGIAGVGILLVQFLQDLKWLTKTDVCNHFSF
jgi:hypothetical protein